MTATTELQLRCEVGGARVPIPSAQVSASADNVEIATHTHGQGTREETIVANYRWLHFVLPLEWGDDRLGNRGVLEDHPGRWSCVIRHSGEPMRSFEFTVNADGSIAPHAEEAAGFTLGFGAHLVDMRVPNTQTYETRVDPATVRRLGIGYGHLLETEAGRANIEALPTLGDATLPQPRAARGSRARRGRR